MRSCPGAGDADKVVKQLAAVDGYVIDCDARHVHEPEPFGQQRGFKETGERSDNVETDDRFTPECTQGDAGEEGGMMRVSVGIDVAKTVHWACAVDEAGRIMLDRAVDNSPDQIASLVSPDKALPAESANPIRAIPERLPTWSAPAT